MTYDLLPRTKKFAKDVRHLVRKLPKDIYSRDDYEQLTRSSGSVGANYIEANESLGKNDFRMHIRISRKEAKESAYWLDLIETISSPIMEIERKRLLDEAQQFVRIFNAILQKSYIARDV